MEPMIEICPSSKDLAFKFLVLVGCNVFLLLRLIEKRGEDGDGGNGCRAFAAWEVGRHKISIFAMSLSQTLVFATRLYYQEGWTVPLF